MASSGRWTKLDDRHPAIATAPASKPVIVVRMAAGPRRNHERWVSLFMRHRDLGRTPTESELTQRFPSQGGENLISLGSRVNGVMGKFAKIV